MPVYEYRCGVCGAVHREVKPVQRRREPSTCACGGEAALILSRPARFQRGPGWKARMDGASMPGEVD